MTQGLPTASRTKVLGSSGTTDMRWEVLHYDNKGQIVTRYSQHYKGGQLSSGNYDRFTQEYTFSGQVEKSTRQHYTGGSNPTLALTVLTEHRYDHRNRLIDTWKTVDGGTRTRISHQQYNPIGQLSGKQLHNTSGSSFAQSISYSYNARGWLTQSSSAHFKEQLYYNAPLSGVTPQYGGNISRQSWQHGSAPEQRYTYRYDALDRLVHGSMESSRGRETLRYDRMGNITHLGRTGTSATRVDTLSYTYSGGRLNSITDGIPTVHPAGQPYHMPGATSYTYDAVGNLTSRINSAQNRHNISAITYNHLNLPASITATSGVTQYTYDAAGTKLSSLRGSTHTEYIEGIEYEDGILSLIHMEEGRILKSGSSYTYEYTLKDHLGNMRSGFRHTAPGSATLRSDYYPFGVAVSTEYTCR